MTLSEKQLNNLTKEALVIITDSLQGHLTPMHEQLNTANAQHSLFDSFNEAEGTR